MGATANSEEGSTSDGVGIATPALSTPICPNFFDSAPLQAVNAPTDSAMPNQTQPEVFRVITV
jgi:hypothetical protein